VFLIPLDNRREIYRYHHLFADLLRSRLTHQAPETVAVVHQRASEWFAAHDRLDAAIQHSLAAGNPEQAADLLASEALLRHATPGQILGWLDQLPEAVLASHPRLAIRQLWVLLESGQLDEVEARLSALALTAVADPDLAQELLVIQIHLARHQQNSEQAIALSQELLAQLPTPPTPSSLPRQLAAVFGLAEAYRLAGELDAAEMQFAEAARLSEMAGSPTYVLRAQLGAAQVQVEQGKWETAVPFLQKISAAAEDFPQEAAMAQLLLAQSPTTRASSDTLPEPLTDRELDVLRWLDSDLTMAEIGAQLFISANTVKTHLKRIYAKLGARGRYEAVAIAKENDLL
jgi:LuxR family transcriptional regulator, maltose regulon positive regulatory protein